MMVKGEPTGRPEAGSRRKGGRRPALRGHGARVQPLRRGMQVAFALLCAFLGVRYLLFVRYLESGGAAPWAERPPGAEGFLPLSALVSLRHLLATGEVHPSHPAGLFLLVAILAVSLLFGKAFCSWICPFGLLSEMLGGLGERVLGGRLRVPRWIDAPLRGLKYLLLAFFLYAIFFQMTAAGIRAFLDSPYNRVADLKMWYFFAHPSRLTLGVLAGLVLLSVPVRGMWCRYLCPYGALLGLLALASPHKIRRRAASCIDCSRCTRACPARIDVARKGTVLSDECSTCLACLDACPVEGALSLESLVPRRRRIPKRLVPAATLVLFLGVTGGARLAGHWRNPITRAQYLEYARHLESYGHPRSSASIEELNRDARTSGGIRHE